MKVARIAVLLVAVVALAYVGLRVFSGPRTAETGDRAPTDTLTDSKGNKVDLAKVFGEGPAVVIVYRGVW
ncbi:MAG TPA: hypothetical protein VNI20_06155 [Fimbriimonadaceae bacterium]|nr:hypothetical protein [Fimbriimonadaceae bacterium]